MRLRKFSLRQALLIAAIVAVPLGAWFNRLHATRRDRLEEAEYHALQEARESRELATLVRCRKAGAFATNPSLAYAEEAARLRVAYHRGLLEKYRTAADRPWTTPPPDPKDPGEDLIWKLLEVEPLEEFRLSAEDWSRFNSLR